MGGFLTRLISLRTKFWSSCQPYKRPMESLLTCIFWVHQYVCHFPRENGFSRPLHKCVICDSISRWLLCPLCLEGRLGAWFSSGKRYKMWLLKWHFRRVFFSVCSSCPGCTYGFLHRKQRSGLGTRISESRHWMGLEDTGSDLSLWVSSCLTSEGTSTLLLKILRKRHMIVLLSDCPFSICSLFHKENFSTLVFCFTK